MRFRTALKVRVGDTIHMKPKVGERSYTVTDIEYGPLRVIAGVRYPLFKTGNGSFTYLLVRIAKDKRGQQIL